MPPSPWKTLSSRLVYQNPWTRVREDLAEMPNGRTTIYGVIECNDCVAVLPCLDDNQVVLVRQYRYVFGENQRWEIPSGGVKPGESIAAAAQRELREEAGFVAGELHHLSTYYPSKSIVREVGHLFLGRRLTRVETVPDETEFLEVAVFPFAEVFQMVIDSEIRDSMSVIAILHAARLLARQDE
jgi:ADP-ribose pyrophosphatase